MTIEIERQPAELTPQAPRTAKVAVLYTSAPTVVQDIGRAMQMADFTAALDKTARARS